VRQIEVKRDGNVFYRFSVIFDGPATQFNPDMASIEASHDMDYINLTKRANEGKLDLAKFGKAGLEFHNIAGEIKVTNVQKDSPGEHAGVLIGDSILKIDDEDVKGRPDAQVIALAETSPRLSLVILRNGGTFVCNIDKQAYW
jgi:C-terminal processing protease CtpA/Prc